VDEPGARARRWIRAGVTVAIDRHVHRPTIPHGIVGNAADAQGILQTIATSVVTLTSLVLTVTLVTVQLAMGRVAPRSVRKLRISH
jgi:uncharacterized membrane protein